MQTRLRILLIEDDPGYAGLVQRLLSIQPSFRFDVSRAGLLSEALAHLESDAHDLILLDLILPDSRGLETLSAIRERAPHAFLFFHCCGSIRDILSDLIEVGVDILNPVQVAVAGMDSRELKREFGRELSFWGGGVDTQQVLPQGTSEQVRDEVRRRVDDLAPGGGFVFAAVHNIQADVPPENILAMRAALRDFGPYDRVASP